MRKKKAVLGSGNDLDKVFKIIPIQNPSGKQKAPSQFSPYSLGTPKQPPVNYIGRDHSGVI